jgi:hypothetical protein
MSRGPGRIQRAISAAFAAEPDNALTTAELCERAYGTGAVDKKHRIAVVRAAKKIAGLDHVECHTLGRQLVFYDPLRVLSYAMARLKADSINDYGTRDPRDTDYGYEGKTEAELRAMLADDEHQKLVRREGAWWLHTEIARARARGDHERVARLKARLDAMFARDMRAMHRRWAKQRAAQAGRR